MRVIFKIALENSKFPQVLNKKLQAAIVARQGGPERNFLPKSDFFRGEGVNFLASGEGGLIFAKFSEKSNVVGCHRGVNVNLNATFL